MTQFFLSVHRENIFSYKKTKTLKVKSLVELKSDPTFKVKMAQYFLSVHREKKLSHFDLKSWVTGGTIFWPGKVSNWRIFESIWLSMLSPFDSPCWVHLTLHVESIWLSMYSQFDSQCWANLTLNVEPIWLSMLSQFWFSMLSQFYSQCWVNLTLNVATVNLTKIFSSYLPILLGQILVPPVTQFFISKWLNFFLSVYHSLQTHNYSELDNATPQSIKISALIYRYQMKHVANIYLINSYRHNRQERPKGECSYTNSYGTFLLFTFY